MKIITIFGSPRKKGTPNIRWAAALDAISARKKRMNPAVFKRMMH